MPENVSSIWPHVPCRNDHSGTIRGENCDQNTGNTQQAQLVFFNTTTKTTNANRTDTPLPVYIGLCVHSRFKIDEMVDELARFGLSVNYRCVMYLEKKMGLSAIQQFTYEGSLSAWTSSETIHHITIRLPSTTSAEYFPWHRYIVDSSTYYHVRLAEEGRTCGSNRSRQNYSSC